MNGDPPAAGPTAGVRSAPDGLVDGAGAARMERSDSTEPTLAPARAAAGIPAVKDPPARPTRQQRPTEVYDQVRRQWVTVGGDPEPERGAPAPPAAAGAVVTAAPQTGAGGARRARLTLTAVDPWSVMKLSFVLSIAGAVVLLVAVWLLWLLLSNGGVFTSVDQTVGDIAGSATSLSIVDIFSLRRVMGITLMLAVVEIILVTALATLAAFLYNLAAGLVGGLDVTLSEDR